MNLIKITTNEVDLVKPYMTPIMSFDEGIIEIIVGWGLAKDKNASILNHNIDNNTYWTFSPREKRKIFEEHIVLFVEDAYKKLIENITIENINPLNFKNKELFLKYIIEQLRGCDGYLYSDRLYIYFGDIIYHIDVNLLKFMSWDIINEIKEILIIKENIDDQNQNYLDIKYIPTLYAKKDTIISNIH